MRYCPWSHPFVEQLIGSCRRECTDHILIWSESDLLAKIVAFQEYFHSYRVHYSHVGKTPSEIDGKRHFASVDAKTFSWKPVCEGMHHTPIAAWFGFIEGTGPRAIPPGGEGSLSELQPQNHTQTLLGDPCGQSQNRFKDPRHRSLLDSRNKSNLLSFPS